MKYFLAFILLVITAGFLVDHSIRSEGWHGPVTDHFDGKHFKNIGVAGDVHGPSHDNGFWKWFLNRPPNTWVWRDNGTSSKPVERVMGDDIVVTMINHASLLVQTQGLNILTDPIWSRRASPFSFVGPSRYRNPGIAFDELPPIDVVIISHDHYDHMDIPSLKKLEEKFHPKILVGLGNKTYLEAHDMLHVEEVDWWEKRDVGNGVTISSVPAQHFSARSFSDRNKTLWGGYMIETKGGNIYFAGDTGYGPFVDEIAKHYSAVRLALIPIGAFHPEFFMGPVHVNPAQALQIAREIHAHTMVPIHYGTFHLADDQQDEPLEKLASAMKESIASTTQVVILSNGESSPISK